ncbi:hypothetical protein MLD38_018072 [Melastoma candidum]|uniref:Uncharacterized protein n=1 Tax=Melastoma candidum TaxID=119954 RepID=A0ACB9QVT4_9MYRT|nr:hypothetical protein MLD38_018072 [Melastoma candidum]
MFTARRNMGRTCIKGKDSWPELVSMDGHQAAATIEAENHNVKANIIDEKSLVIQNFDCTRVWVRVNSEGKVSETPKIG